MSRPLEGLLVLDCAQFLAGPIAALRLADLGARVVKVEPPTGEVGRKLYLSELAVAGESALFQTINRGKEGIAVDLKDPGDRARVERLIAKADVAIMNFRPGVAERLGLDWATLSARHPRLVHASLTGYGETGPWTALPGQDLLVQARSGLVWLSGNADDPPTPIGISVVDLHAGGLLVQGILACLVRRGVTGEGGSVQTSLLEAALDLQVQEITHHLNDGNRPPERSAVANAHPYLAAPYGIYACAEGWLALAMQPLGPLAEALGLPELAEFTPHEAFTRRDEIKALIARHLPTRPARDWAADLVARGLWCAEVLTWDRLLASEAAAALDVTREVRWPDGATLRTTRCPIRVDGEILDPTGPAPHVGADTPRVLAELDTLPRASVAGAARGARAP
jgi:CoA:oxalate CoA-transferase